VPGTDPGNLGDLEVNVVLGEHPQIDGRAFLGIMGVPVIMGDSMTCSGTAQAEPVEGVMPDSSEESGKGNNIPKTQTEEILPAPAISGTEAITTAMIYAPDSASDTGLWLWCPLEEGAFHCQYPSDLDAPIFLEPSDALSMPVAPQGISGGAILPGTEITSTEVITPGEAAPVEIGPLPEQPLFYCWMGDGFELCPPMAPMGPIAPGPSTDPGSK
jgi:hypothetical protein